MENFRLKHVMNIRISGIIIPLILLLFVMLSIFSENTPRQSDFLKGFHGGFQAGLFLLFEGYWLLSLIRSVRVLKNEDYRRKLYIKETDERTQFVMMKSGAGFVRLFLIILAAAGLISSFFSDAVFFTLLGVVYAVLLLKLVLMLYYNKKY